jgi:hypothetical protein
MKKLFAIVTLAIGAFVLYKENSKVKGFVDEGYNAGKDVFVKGMNAGKNMKKKVIQKQVDKCAETLEKVVNKSKEETDDKSSAS